MDIKELASYTSAVSSIITLALVLIKPLRAKIFGLEAIRKGQQCALRNDMMTIYYKHKDSKTIPEYEKQTFLLSFEAYIALGGNSFIKDIEKAVRSWEVEK